MSKQKTPKLTTPCNPSTLKHSTSKAKTPAPIVYELYTGESWDNVRPGSLDPNRPRIRGLR